MFSFFLSSYFLSDRRKMQDIQVLQQINMLTNYILFQLEPKIDNALASVERNVNEESGRGSDVDEGSGDEEGDAEAEAEELKKLEAKIKKERLVSQ